MAKQEKQSAAKESSTKEAQVNGANFQATADAKSVLINNVSQKGTQVEKKITESKSSIEPKSSTIITSAVSHTNSDTIPTEEKLKQPMISFPSIEVKCALPHQATSSPVQIKLNESLLADKIASSPKESKEDDGLYGVVETSKDQSSGMFHRLRNFFGLTRSNTETKTGSYSTEGPSGVSSETQTPAQTPEIPKGSKPSHLLSAVDTIISSPSSLRHLTSPIPESESLHSATKLPPPTINTMVRSSDQFLSLPNVHKIALFPSTIPQTSQSLQDHYTRQVGIYKPDGMSDVEIQKILSGWLKIVNWSPEELNEISMRQVVRMTLSSAFDIMQARKRERQIRQEEELASQSKGDETEEEVWYPLTELPGSANQSGDRRVGGSGTLETKMKEQAEAESESKELPTKSANQNVDANDDKLSAKKGSIDTNDFHTIDTPGIQSVAAEQISTSQGANPWTVKPKVQTEENRAIPS